MLEGFDGDTPKLRAPKTKATVRKLATHTSGLAYWFWNRDIVRWEEATGTPNVLSGDEVIFTAPLVADPGTTYEYGINTDWLGRVVEAASDSRSTSTSTERILEPLGMEHTAFAIGDEQRARPGADPPAGRGRRMGGDRDRLGAASRTGGPAATASTPRRATTCASSGCCSTAARSTACRS